MNRRTFLEYLAKGLGALGVLGLPLVGSFLKKGAPEQVYGRSQGDVMITKMADIPDMGSAKFMTAKGPGILVRFNDELKAFSASCTHMGCPVSGKELEAKGLLVCPCHGSTFDPLTGDRVSGPAPKPLGRIEIEIRGEDIYALV